jgi:preprotein translocase subunit YajC
VFVNVLTANTAQPQSGGIDFMTIALFVIFGLLIFTMFRKQRKTQAQMREKTEQMKERLVPGTPVMTQFGLYGTVVSVNRDENKVVLELSPGNTATVHLQAVTEVTEPAAQTVVPDDASSLTEPEAGTAGSETPEETLKHLNDEKDNGK